MLYSSSPGSDIIRSDIRIWYEVSAGSDKSIDLSTLTSAGSGLCSSISELDCPADDKQFTIFKDINNPTFDPGPRSFNLDSDWVFFDDSSSKQALLTQYEFKAPSELFEKYSGMREIIPALSKDLSGKVDAIFYLIDMEDEVIEVYAVVEEHNDEVYDLVVAVEERFVSAFPDKTVNFKVRAHQGRDPSSVVPIKAKRVNLM